MVLPHEAEIAIRKIVNPQVTMYEGFMISVMVSGTTDAIVNDCYKAAYDIVSVVGRVLFAVGATELRDSQNSGSTAISPQKTSQSRATRPSV